ncbi:amidohydrolase family protein [Haloplanus sp. GCM10025708]|uniref:amidohydrolase family protein n=1 Tax=Haloplanus sp. GCM10025708 TaxID=3252679 RepID=UPI00361497B1
MSKPTRSLDVEIVDSDFHTTESESDLYPYLEAPFDEMLQVDDSYFGQFYPSAGYVTPVDTGRAEMDKIRSADDVRDAMELLGTDASVITPGLNLRLGMVHHDDLAAAFATAYNEWALDTILDDVDDVYGTAVVAPQKPEKAVAEIERRADETSVVGVTIPSGGMTPPAGHERYFPIYEAAERAGLPVLLHNAGTGLMANFPTSGSGRTATSTCTSRTTRPNTCSTSRRS